MASLQLSPRNRLRVPRCVNDNQCVISVTGLKDSVYGSGQIGLNPSPVTAWDKKVPVTSHVDFCVANAHSVTRLPQKKDVNPNYCYKYTEIKYVKDVSCVGHLSSANAPPVVICERCFLCRSLEFCKCPTCCYTSTCRGKATQFLGEMGSSGFKSKSSRHTRRGLHPPLPVQTEPNQITNCHKQLQEPIQTGPPFRGTVSAGEQKCSRTGSKPKLTRVLQPAIFGTQTQQPVETGPGPEHLEHLPKHRVIQNGDPRDNKDLPTVGGVGHIHRLQGRILPYTNSQSVQEVHAFSHPGPVLPVQSPTLWPVHSTHGVHSGGQRGQTDGFTGGYKNPPVPRRLVGESHIPPNSSPAYTDLGSSLSRTRLAGEQGEVRTGAKAGFQLRRLPVRPQGGQGQTHTRSLADLTRQDIVNPVRSGVPVRQFMSLIGLLTATEKQVHLG